MDHIHEQMSQELNLSPETAGPGEWPLYYDESMQKKEKKVTLGVAGKL